LSDGSDPEMVDMAKMQLEEAKAKLPKLEDEIKFMPDTKGSGRFQKRSWLRYGQVTGGDEASIFAGDLFRMYTKIL